jgi:hypothetical protein
MDSSVRRLDRSELRLQTFSNRFEPADATLCKNTKAINRDRRNCSSKTALVARLASEFNLEVELEKYHSCRVSIFEFLHSQVKTGSVPG